MMSSIYLSSSDEIGVSRFQEVSLSIREFISIVGWLFSDINICSTQCVSISVSLFLRLIRIKLHEKIDSVDHHRQETTFGRILTIQSIENDSSDKFVAQWC